MTTQTSSRFDTLTTIFNRPSGWTSRGDFGEIVSIILLNDNETCMTYVVEVLVQIFEMSAPLAKNTMNMAHDTGNAVVGLYSRGIVG